MKGHFIRTSDISTYKTLLKEGFQLIDQTGKYYTFLNSVSDNEIAKFSENVDTSKIQYSDVLCI